MKIRPVIWIALAGLAGAGLLALFLLNKPAEEANAAANHPIYLPLASNAPTPTATGVALPPPDEASSRITVPPGFAIRIFSQGLSAPRLMTTGPDGWIYVAEIGSGEVARLPDRNRNGIADGIEVVASGLNEPHDVEFYKNYMYVAELGKIERFSNPNANGVYQTRELVTDNIPVGPGHTSRTLHFGPDGMLYVSAGSSCNICVESDPRRAAILRFTPDGKIPADNPFAKDPDPRKQAVWAYGLRNAVDFLWTPQGALWADQNGSDGLGDNIPPEEIINVIQPGKWYGWPYCYTPVLGLNQPPQPEVPDPRMTPPAGVNCSQATPALMTDLAHSAPLGMTLGTKSNFPASYKNNLFIAYHGSWNTSDPANYRDCKVEMVVVQNGAPVRTETFANGWRTPGKLCGDPTTYGRPAGVTFGSDGALYISDDRGGRIYRVVYTGK